jgi:hypothetical protein
MSKDEVKLIPIKEEEWKKEKTNVCITIEVELANKIKELAKKERRSVSAMYSILLEDKLNG